MIIFTLATGLLVSSTIFMDVVLGNVKNLILFRVISHQKFRLRNDAGEILEGVTDANGHSSLLDSVDLNSYRMELLS